MGRSDGGVDVLTGDEAMRMAEDFAKVPELPQNVDTGRRVSFDFIDLLLICNR